MTALRFYTFINMYTGGMGGPIHGGIQSAHVVHRTIYKYLRPMTAEHRSGDPEAKRGNVLREWMAKHETMIVCSAGYAENLDKLTDVISRAGEQLCLPWGTFNESEAALKGLQTGVGLVLPEELFDVVDYRTANNAVTNGADFQAAWPFKSTSKTALFYLGAPAFAGEVPGAEEGDIVVRRAYLPGSIEHELMTAVKACPLAR